MFLYPVVLLMELYYILFCTMLGIHRLKQSMPKRKAGKMAKSYDPIAPVAEEISEEACLLCFDEFQVCMSVFLNRSMSGESAHSGMMYVFCVSTQRRFANASLIHWQFIYNSHFRWPISLTPWFSSSSLRISFRTESSLSPPLIGPQKVC